MKRKKDDKPKSTIFKTLCNFFLVCLFTCTVLTSFILLVGYYRSPIVPKEIKGLKRVELEGRYAVNDLLTLKKSIRLEGPECIVEDRNMNIYTGLSNGYIVKIHPSENGTVGGGRVEVIFRSEFKDAAKTVADAKHGRPLGMRIIKDTLYVMDAIYGMYRIDLDTREAKLVVGIDQAEPNLSFPDDLDVTSDGEVVFFTDATAKYNLNNFMLSVLEGSCTGRLFKYTVKTKELQLMRDGMCFCNGVQLSSGENLVAVAETMTRSFVLVDTDSFQVTKTFHLPAHPDNIRMNKDGNFLIATNSPPNKVSDFMASRPWLARILAGIFPYDFIKDSVDARHSIIVEVSQEGNLVRAYHDSQGHVITGAAHCAQLSDGSLAIGSFFDSKLSIVGVN